MTTDLHPVFTPDRNRIEVKYTPDGRTLMVTDLLEKKGYAPIIGRRPPFWNPPMPAALRDVIKSAHIPNVSWRRTVRDGVSCTDIDGNAAFLSAISSVTYAHGDLVHTGPWRDDQFIKPGYYLVDVYPWQGETPGSPLGSKPITTDRVWVTHQTYRNLRDLCHGSSWCKDGLWPDATAHDSWTCETSMRLTKWTDCIRDLRIRFIETDDRHAYNALKRGYSQTVQMWDTPPDPKGTPWEDREKKNQAYRPDWYDTLHSQHSFTMWRRAYMAADAGHPPIQVGGRGHVTDGMCFRTSDLTAVLAVKKWNRPPITLDASSKSLGTFKMTVRHGAGDIADEGDDG